MSKLPTGPRRLALASWVILGVALALWLGISINASPLAWLIGLGGSWLALGIAMIRSGRNAFAYAMLASIIYTLVGIMELLSQPRSYPIAAGFAGIALLTFFAVIPATRFERRADKTV